MRYIIALLCIFIVACSSQPEIDGTIESEKKYDSPLASSKWVGDLRDNKPEWFTCTQDNDCVTVATECGSNCRGEAINSKFYADYTVGFSDACQGEPHSVRKCEATERRCVAGVCQIEFKGY